MTWLQMEFVLISITSPSPAKLGRTAQQQLLTLASLTMTKVIGALGLNLKPDIYFTYIAARQCLDDPPDIYFGMDFIWPNKNRNLGSKLTYSCPFRRGTHMETLKRKIINTSYAQK